MTRIVYIITRLSVGSPAMHATLLTRLFNDAQYESVLICGRANRGSGDMTYFAEAQGVEPIIVPELGQSPLMNIIAVFKLYRWLRKLRPDVVHTHLTQAGVIGRLAARLAGVPVIVHTVHSHVFGGQYSPLNTRLFILLERLATAQSDTIITLNQSLRFELVERYHIARQGRIMILPLGLDLKGIANFPHKSGDFRRVWSIPEKAPLVGIVGQIAPVKNHILFLQAARLVKAQIPEAHFVIVGDGGIRREIEAQVDALKLRDCVTFTGWQRDLAPLYSDLDVLVNSSTSEGTPTPIIEALTAGCPVVATAVGGVPDLLDHGRLGRLALPNNPDSLAQTIVAALREPLENTNAPEIMRNRYSIERLVTDLNSLYEGLLAKKGASRQRE